MPTTLMRKTPARPAGRATLNLRISPAVRGLIDRGAELAGKNRTEFMLDAARRAAEDAVLDQVVLMAGPDAYRDFLARLDAPAQPNARLRRTMKTIAPWNVK